MKTAIIFLATGFEEAEALIPYDILTRGGVATHLVSVTGSKTVVSSHNVSIVAHQLIEDVLPQYDLLLLPGGMPGSLNLNNHDGVKAEISDAVRQNKTVSAICAAPMVLGEMGLLAGRRATCYPGFEQHLRNAITNGNQVEHDGQFITGIGAGAAFEFSLELLATLTDSDNAQKVKEQIILK